MTQENSLLKECLLKDFPISDKENCNVSNFSNQRRALKREDLRN